MSRRLRRRDLRRGAPDGRLRRLPGRALDRRGLLRQAAIGLAGSLVCAGALALEISVQHLAARWSDAAGQTLIVVPDPSAPSAVAGRSRLAAVLSAAGTARPVGPQALASLLGATAPDAAALVETLADDPGMAARIQAAAPGSIVEADGGQPAARLAAFGSLLSFACRAALAAIVAATLACVIAGARAAIRASAGAASLVHRLGMTGGAIGRLLSGPLTAAAFLGGAAGIASSALVLSGHDLAPLYPLPPAIALATLIAAGLALRHVLRDDM